MEVDVITLPVPQNITQGYLKFKMSTIYAQISKTNFDDYSSNMKILSEEMLRVLSSWKDIIDGAGEKFLEDDEFLKEFDKYKYIYEEDKPLVDTIFESPMESCEIAKLFLNELSDEDRVNFKGAAENSQLLIIQEVFKTGLIAIAFEAFACEALLNEELTQIMTKNSLNRLEKEKGKPKYEIKIETIVRNYQDETPIIPRDLLDSVGELMKVRNKIVHFKEYKLNLMALFNNLSNLTENQVANNMYIGELFTNIAVHDGTYRKLEEFILNLKGNK